MIAKGGTAGGRGLKDRRNQKAACNGCDAHGYSLRSFYDIAMRDRTPLPPSQDNEVIRLPEQADAMAYIQGVTCMAAGGEGFLDFVELGRREEKFRAGRHARIHPLQKRIGFRNLEHADLYRANRKQIVDRGLTP